MTRVRMGRSQGVLRWRAIRTRLAEEVGGLTQTPMAGSGVMLADKGTGNMKALMEALRRQCMHNLALST